MNINTVKLKLSGCNKFGISDTVNMLNLVIVEKEVYFDNIMDMVMLLTGQCINKQIRKYVQT